MATGTASKAEDFRPVVWIDPKAYYKFSLWAKLAGSKKREYTALGIVEKTDQGNLYVTEAHLIKHTGSGAYVEGDDESIMKLTAELYQRDPSLPEKIRCWVHSHPGTGPSATYLSGTDENNINEFMTGEFLVSIVLDSNGGNPYTRIDMREPRLKVEADLMIDYPYLTKEEIEDCRKEFEEKSSARVYTTQGRLVPRTAGGYANGYGGFDSTYGDSDFYSGYSSRSSGGKGSGGKGSGGKRKGSAAASGASKSKNQSTTGAKGKGAEKADAKDGGGKSQLQLTGNDGVPVAVYDLSDTGEVADSVEHIYLEMDSGAEEEEASLQHELMAHLDEAIDEVVEQVQLETITPQQGLLRIESMGLSMQDAKDELTNRLIQ